MTMTLWKLLKSLVSPSAPAQEQVLREGRVTLLQEGKVVASGKNRLTKAARVNVARILALTSGHAARTGVTFLNDEGVSLPLTPADSSLLPAYISAGTGATATTGEETELVEPIVDAEWTLRRVDVRASAAAYGSTPILVAYEFDIPEGDVTENIQEWGLHASDGTLLARFLSPVLGNPSLSLVVRWEWLV